MHYPAYKDTDKKVEFADVGCGYGGLLGKEFVGCLDGSGLGSDVP